MLCADNSDLYQLYQGVQVFTQCIAKEEEGQPSFPSEYLHRQGGKIAQMLPLH